MLPQTKKILDLVNNSHKIAVVPSLRLDTDAIGGALGLSGILKLLGKESDIIYSGPTLGYTSFLPGIDKIILKDTTKVNFSKYDLLFLLDGAEPHRFYDSDLHKDKGMEIPDSVKIIVIDHHVTAGEYGTVSVLDPQASSASELVYRIFNGEVKITREIASNLFAGISGDTGHFRFGHVNPEVFRIAADLIESGADWESLILNVFNSIKFSEIKGAADIAAKARIDNDYRYILVTLNPQDQKRLNLSDDEARSALSMARDNLVRLAIEADFVVSLRDEGQGSIHGSFRSRAQGKYDLATLAGKFDRGGGHKDAAGFLMENTDLVKAEERLKTVVSENLESVRLK